MTIARTVAQVARRGRILCLVFRYMSCTAQLSLLGSVRIVTQRTGAIGTIAYPVAT
jgi:hypothetical protein